MIDITTITEVDRSEPAPSPFLPDTQIRYAWDSTTLGAFKTCPRLYYYQYIEGWASKDESVHLRFGQEYHSALEGYQRLKTEGVPHEEALHMTVRSALELSFGWEVDTTTKAGKYKNRRTLIELIIANLDHYADDAAQVVVLEDGRPAVELSFRFELDWGPKAATLNEDNAPIGEDIGAVTQPYLLCGHLDRVVSFQDALFVMDHKAQPLSTKVLCLNGWTEIGKLAIGNSIAGRDGKFYEVKGLYPKGVTEVYEITFNDKTSVLCAADHLWTVTSNVSVMEKTITTLELLYKPQYVKYCVPLCQPIQHPEALLPVHPYIVGALLGDGYLNGNSVVLSSSKEWLVCNVVEFLDTDIIRKAGGDNYDWIIKGGQTLNGMRNLGLMGTLAGTKFIPNEYKYASEAQRRELLRGLLDTDGSWNERSRIYDSISIMLIEDICEIVRSLGGTARYRDRGDGCYRASLRLPEWPTGVGNRYIKSVERITDEETVCIETSAPDGLYITENHIVTHNTATQTLSDYYFAQFEPNNQMSLYSLAAKIVLATPIKGVIIDGAQVLLEDPHRFVRRFTYRTEDQTQEWLDDLRMWLQIAEQYATVGYWPMNDTACDKFDGCRFRDICSKSPQVRDRFLASNFKKLEKDDIWNPLRAR